MKIMKKFMVVLLFSILSLLVFGCSKVQQTNNSEGTDLPLPAGTDSALAGQGYATETYDNEYQLYNNFRLDGSMTSYLVENGRWVYLGSLSNGQQASRSSSDFSVTVIRDVQSQSPGLKLETSCRDYKIYFDSSGNYIINQGSSGSITSDQFTASLRRPQPIRQISGTDDAITIHSTSSNVAWFTLHCDEESSVPMIDACLPNDGSSNLISISRNDQFILTGATGNTYSFEYKGADRISLANPKIIFENMETGETLEYSANDCTGTTTCTVSEIHVGGEIFMVQKAEPQTNNDYKINVGLPGNPEGDCQIADFSCTNGATNPPVCNDFPGLSCVLGCYQVVTLLIGESVILNPRPGAGGPSIIFELEDITYQPYVGGIQGVNLRVDSSSIPVLQLNEETYVASGRMRVSPISLLYQDYAGGVRGTTLCLN
jgi:hypothetical protein